MLLIAHTSHINFTYIQKIFFFCKCKLWFIRCVILNMTRWNIYTAIITDTFNAKTCFYINLLLTFKMIIVHVMQMQSLVKYDVLFQCGTLKYLHYTASKTCVPMSQLNDKFRQIFIIFQSNHSSKEPACLLADGWV